MDTSLLSLFLHDGILDYFEITGFDKIDSKLHTYTKRLTIHLEEKKLIPEAYKNHNLRPVVLWNPLLLRNIPLETCW